MEVTSAHTLWPHDAEAMQNIQVHFPVNIFCMNELGTASDPVSRFFLNTFIRHNCLQIAEEASPVKRTLSPPQSTRVKAEKVKYSIHLVANT